MRRRDFLRLGATLPATLISRRARGETTPITRAAVVIGVDKPQGMPPLNAAVSGARQVGDWLTSEGISVKLIVDDQTPVKAEDIFDEVDKYVSLGTLQQLIVYFAGHGSFVGTGEYWLLSRALHNSNQAVSVSQFPYFAKQCGVPNVVIVSDACRSTSSSLKIQSLTGSNIFPTVNNRNVRTALDIFYATTVGAPAYEVKDSAGKWDGIYTKCLLEAYINPDAKMTDEVDGIKVVLNKKLEAYLLSTVPARAQISDKEEYPDASVTSSAYIGRAIEAGVKACRAIRRADNSLEVICSSDLPDRPKTIGEIPITVNSLAEFKLRQAGVDLSLSPNVQPSISPASWETVDDVGFGANQDLLLSARGPNVFPTQTGINVFGTRLRSISTQGMDVQRVREPNGPREPTVLQLTPSARRQESIVLEFESGSGTVIAGLRGYAATVVVSNERVISVSYERAQQGELATSPLNEHVAQLRAVVATAAKFGVFRIDGPPGVKESNAAKLADSIRVEKSFDPTLGLYAAYAYAAAGLEEGVRSVYSIMRTEEIELFDVALLADALRSSDNNYRAPFCPMLNQGWQYLAVKNVTLPPRLAPAQAHILPSLWTTFDSEGISILKSAL